MRYIPTGNLDSYTRESIYWTTIHSHRDWLRGQRVNDAFNWRYAKTRTITDGTVPLHGNGTIAVPLPYHYMTFLLVHHVGLLRKPRSTSFLRQRLADSCFLARVTLHTGAYANAALLTYILRIDFFKISSLFMVLRLRNSTLTLLQECRSSHSYQLLSLKSNAQFI